MAGDEEENQEEEEKEKSRTHSNYDGGSESREPSSLGSSAGSIFCTLERDYARIMIDMKSNEALAAYETEYTRLFESLYETHRNEQELMEKCRNLQDEVIDKTSKAYDLEKMVESQEENINKLKQEIVDALKLADAAHSREQNSQEVIENLRLTITKLNHELEQLNKQLAMDEDTKASKQKEGWLKERERILNELDSVKSRLKNTELYAEELDKKLNEREQQISELQENLDIQRSENAKEHKIRERLEKDLQQLDESVKFKDNQLQTSDTSIKFLTSNITRLENSLKEQNTLNEKLQKEVNKLMVKRMNLETELSTVRTKMDELEKSTAKQNKEYKLFTSDAKRMAEENEKLKVERERAQKKIMLIDSQKFTVAKELEQVKLSLRNAEFEIGSLHRQIEDEKKATAAIVREKDALATIILTLKEKLKRADDTLAGIELAKRKVEAELDETMQATNEMKNKLNKIESERDKLRQDCQELAQQVEDRLDELKLKQVEVFDCKKRLAESEAKFRQQQNLFEAVRAERNTCSKNLIEAHDEIQELKNKLKIIGHQIEQLKEDVTSKETSLIKEEFLLGKAEKDKDNLRAELHSCRKTIGELRKEIEEGNQEQKRLRQTIQMADVDVSRLKKDIDTVMNERDILGTQLVRRNDELSLQYSRIKILNGTIQRGETQYSQRLDDIRLLKLEVKNLRTQKVLLSKSIANMSDLRHEIFNLGRQLANERLKVMALEEEVQTPLNIHRWRKLEGTDPDTFELLKKIQTLQKRVLKMSAEMIAKEKKIKECMELYINLRRELWKYPKPDVVETLKETQKALRDRGDKMKCLVAELNMSETQSNGYKYDVERLNRELRDMKTKYYAEKRKNQKSKDEDKRKVQSASEPILPAIQPCHKKFCGGGFNMAVLTPRNCHSLESAQK